MSTSKALTADEKTSARAIRAAFRPKLNPTAWTTAINTSIAQHGDDRHSIIKWHALHARADQLR